MDIVFIDCVGIQWLDLRLTLLHRKEIKMYELIIYIAGILTLPIMIILWELLAIYKKHKKENIEQIKNTIKTNKNKKNIKFKKHDQKVGKNV